MRNTHFVFIALGAALLSGCGSLGPAFDPSYPETDGDGLTRVLSRLEPPATEPTIVGASLGDGVVFAYDPSRERELFTKNVRVTRAPIVAGAVIVLSDGERAIGLRRDGGEELFAHPLDGRYVVGAAGVGDSVVLALSSDRGRVDGIGTVTMYRAGRKAWERDLEHPVGTPALAGDTVVVPWAHQNLSFLRAEDGVEIARARALGTVLGHAELHPLGLVAGQRELVHVEPSLAGDPRIPTAARLSPPAAPLPGKPGMRPDAYARPEPPSSARHRVRLDAFPARGEAGLVAEGGLHYFAFHSVVLGMRDGEVEWAAHPGGEIAGLSAAEGGAHVVTTTGDVLFLSSRDGSVLTRKRLPRAPDLAALVGLEAPEGEPERPAASDESRAPGLIALSRARNAQLTPVATLAVKSLSNIETPTVTAELISLCDEPNVSPPVRRAACAALGERTVGAGDITEALARRASFIEGTTAPPVAALARAAVKMGERSLAPPLAEHLLDPATPSAELAAVARSLGELGGEAATSALRTFLSLYHAYGGDPALAEALVAAAEALRAIEGASADAFFGALRDDPFTLPALANALR